MSLEDYSIFDNLLILRDVVKCLNEEGVARFAQLGLDEHDIARCGVCDSSNFDIWRTLMPFIVRIPYIGTSIKEAGPFYIITTREGFNRFIRDFDKNADYHGNNSVHVINRQVSPHTVFSTADRCKHAEKRYEIKTYFSSIAYESIDEVVRRRIGLARSLGDVVVHDFVNGLVLEIFRKFIGCTESGVFDYNTYVLKSCIDDFQRNSSTISLIPSDPSMSLDHCKALLCANEHIDDDDVIALMKVGFGNIHSMLSSIMFQMATYFDELKEKIALKNDRISLDLNYDTPVNRFFLACYVLAPPVWIMGRKVGYTPMEVDGVNFPPHAMVLVPWFHILRRQYGNEFNMDQFNLKDIHQLAPFSAGANSCIGRYIAIPLIESVIGNLLKYNLELVSAPDGYEGKVFLSYKTSPVIKIL